MKSVPEIRYKNERQMMSNLMHLVIFFIQIFIKLDKKVEQLLLK